MAGENLQERRRLAATYALALYDLAVEKGLLEMFRSELAGWKTVLEQTPQLQAFFDSVLITEDERENFLERLGTNINPVLMSFLGVLNHRHRLGLLPEVIRAFGVEDDRRTNRIPVKLCTAVDVDSSLMDEIVARLRTFLKGEPMIEHQVDPGIIGGFIAKAGDMLIDASDVSRLSNMKKSLMKRGEDEIQSRRDFIGYKA